MSEDVKKIMPPAPAQPKPAKGTDPVLTNTPNQKPAAPDPSPFKMGPT